MAVKDLRKIQIGWEATAGTAVAATKVYRGMGTLENTTEVVIPEENVGLVADQDRAYIPFIAGALELEPVEATFEQLHYFGELGIKLVATPTADGSGSDKIWSFPYSVTGTPNVVKTATIEGGDDQAAEELEYAFLDSFKIEGKAKEALKVSGSCIGRQISTSAFTGALVAPTVEEILLQTGKLYIDAVGGTIGTTQKSNTFLGMALSVKTGVQPVWTGDGNKYFSFIKYTKPIITLDLTFEHDGSSVAEKANWLSLTSRLIQLKFEGSATATGGTTYQKKTLILNLCGKWTKFGKIEEENGNDIIKGSFKCLYNTTAAKFFEMIVVNEVATL